MVTAYPLPEGFTELEVFGLGTTLLVSALLGMILNSLTLLSFYKIRSLRTPHNFLIVSLALADSGICLNAFIASFSTFLRYWPYGSEGCQVHGFQGYLTALASISSCGAIAWDRYNQYCTRSKLQWSTALSLLSFIWAFSAFWSVMPLIGWGHYDYEPLRTCCTLDYTKGDKIFISFVFSMAFFEFVIPLFIMLTAYQSVEQKFKKTGQHKFNTSLPVKTLVMCWGPYVLLYFFAMVENVNVISPKIQMLPAIMAKCSPAINAYVYGLGNESYRAGIWQFLTGQKIEKEEVNNKVK